MPLPFVICDANVMYLLITGVSNVVSNTSLNLIRFGIKTIPLPFGAEQLFTCISKILPLSLSFLNINLGSIFCLSLILA